MFKQNLPTKRIHCEFKMTKILEFGSKQTKRQLLVLSYDLLYRDSNSTDFSEPDIKKLLGKWEVHNLNFLTPNHKKWNRKQMQQQ